MSTPGILALIGTLVLAVGIGLALRARVGRVRAAGGGAPAVDGWRLAGGQQRGTGRVLLLQLSSPVCTPCRQAAALLGELSERTAGLHHVEIDVADRPDVARRLGVLRTPTVIAYDGAGAELLRVSGVPRVPDLMDALTPALR